MGIESIILDSREPKHILQLTFGGVPVATTTLDAGDLVAACSDNNIVVIERKTAEDFLGTLEHDRLFPQMAKIRQVSPFAYLVICGDLRPGPNGMCWANGKERGWNWSSVQGALATVQEMGVCVIYAANELDYEQTVIRLANRDRSQVRVKPARDLSIISDQEVILSSLPGIGAEKAKALYEFTGSVAWAIAYLTDTEYTGTNVPGIGDVTKRNIRRTLGLKEDEELCVILKDNHQVLKREVA